LVNNGSICCIEIFLRDAVFVVIFNLFLSVKCGLIFNWNSNTDRWTKNVYSVEWMFFVRLYLFISDESPMSVITGNEMVGTCIDDRIT